MHKAFSNVFQASRRVTDASCCHSVAKSCLTLWPHGQQHARLFCPSLSPRVCWNSCALSWWCNLTISCSAAPFSFCLQFFPASGSFPVHWLSHQVAKVLEVQPEAQWALINTNKYFLQDLSKASPRISSRSIFSENSQHLTGTLLIALITWKCYN